MDLDQVRCWLDSERRTGVLDGDEFEVLPLITRTHSADRSRHAVCFSALSDDNADECIAEQVKYFRTNRSAATGFCGSGAENSVRGPEPFAAHYA